MGSRARVTAAACLMASGLLVGGWTTATASADTGTAANADADATGGGADPQALAGDISLALYTTADGLVIAIPKTILAGMIQIRLSRLTDATAEQLNEFFQELQEAMA